MIAALCVILSIDSKGDFKGSYVLMQLPIALQLSLLLELGAKRFLVDFSWTKAYLAIAVPTMLVLYAIGHVLGTAVRKMRAIF